MSTRTVTIVAPEGLHARPAAEFAKAAAAAGVAVTVEFGGKSVNAASILGVLSLGVMRGSEVTLSSDAPDADEALDGLVALLESQHD
jgi:phosphocarrier protein